MHAPARISPPPPEVEVLGVDHVQLAAPAGSEEQARSFYGACWLQLDGAEVDWDASLDPLKRFYTHDPWGNRIELIESPQPAPGDA
jgi:hypothetical protein